MFVKSMACQAISALEMQLLLPPWLETTVERPSDSAEMLSLALVSFWGGSLVFLRSARDE